MEMAFPTQFALTLELTRLIPLNLVGNTAQRAVLALARQLRNSNSDIIIEEDLAELFGRSRVAPLLESSFRAVVSQGNANFLTNDIVLAGGPGPTVSRGLRERPYFSTIVQLSLLTWVHDNNALAQGLVEAIEKRLEHAPPGERAPPGQQGVCGTLTACEEQTSAYDWYGLLHAVGTMLDMSLQEIKQGMLVDILCGLLDMLPMVQTLPSDRMIHIEGRDGICITVVWAHHVLGLTVLVKTAEGKEICFGNGEEQVYIDASTWIPSIALFDCSGESRDTLFFIKPDIDQVPIDTCFKTPVKGYGKIELRDACRYNSSEAAITQDLIAVILAIALIVHSKLTSHNGRFRLGHPMRASERRVVEAARIFFDEPNIDEKIAWPYINSYRNQSLKASLRPPLSIEIMMKEETPNHHGDIWGGLLYVSRNLAIILLALAHVDNLLQCQDLPIGSFGQIGPQKIVEALEEWDGQTPLTVEDGTWFELLTLLVVGHGPTPEINYLSLISGHGWSIYMTSFSDADPASLTPGIVKITNGVPYRNGVRKSGVVDGPIRGIGGVLITKVADEGHSISPRNAFTVERRRTLFSERGDNFAISLLFVTRTESDAPEVQPQFRRTGYRELHKALWLPMRSASCSHSTKDSLTLSPGCTAVSGFPEDPSRRPEERILIILTANNEQARWRALLAAADLDMRQRVSGGEKVLLRTNDCCLPCAVAQVIRQDGNWTIIL
jgi:hypothetical protein